jgi:hypothetical protein
MGRPKSKGAYAPLAAHYYLDDAILEAGPDAELLWVRVLSFLASVPQADGFITDRQIRTVGIGLRGVPKRVSKLQDVGLLSAEPGGFAARSWHKWNRSAQEVGKFLAKDRERKAQKAGEVGPNSARKTTPFRTDSVLQSSTEQNSTDTTPKGVVPRKRGSRIPDPFIVTAEMRRWAAEKALPVDVDRATEKFVNHWRAKPGQGALKLDWTATWRNWLLNDADRNVSKPTPTERAQRTVRLATDIDPKELEK